MAKVNSMALMPVSRRLRMVHDLSKNLFGPASRGRGIPAILH
jgi:hypothetical protein